MSRRRKIIIRGLLVCLLLLIMLLVGASVYMLRFSLYDDSGKDIAEAQQRLEEEYPHIKTWADSLRTAGVLRDTSMVSQDGRRFHALYAEASDSTARTALILHGYTCNAYYYLYVGYLFHHTLGYNIFLPDIHAHGESDGDAIRMGWKDADDMMEWLPIIKGAFSVKDSCRIVVHGTSMGGATAMNLSGREHDPAIKCYIEDSGYTSVWDEFSYELSESFGLPSFPLLHSTSLLCKLNDGWSFGEASSVEEVKKCHKPMLFIHSDNDDFVPSWMVHPLYESKPMPKQLWIVPKSAHHLAYHDYPEEYARRVKSFVETYM